MFGWRGLGGVDCRRAGVVDCRRGRIAQRRYLTWGIIKYALVVWQGVCLDGIFGIRVWNAGCIQPVPMCRLPRSWVAIGTCMWKG